MEIRVVDYFTDDEASLFSDSNEQQDEGGKEVSKFVVEAEPVGLPDNLELPEGAELSPLKPGDVVRESLGCIKDLGISIASRFIQYNFL